MPPYTDLYLVIAILVTAAFYAMFSHGDDVDTSWQKRALVSLLIGFLFPILGLIVLALAVVLKLLELWARITEGPE